MQEIFNFLKENWQLIVAVITLIVSVVIAIIRKRPVNDILYYIYESCVNAVLQAEQMKVSADGHNFSYLKGKDKLEFAVSCVIESLKVRFPDLKVMEYKSLIVETIEDILTTPQKKGE